jgi:hypothetical protein
VATIPDGYQPIDYPGFGRGVNLRDQPDELTPAQLLDALNVTFTDRDGVRTRDGYSKFTGSQLTNQPDSMAAHYETDGTVQLVVGNGNRLDALDTTGASVANAATTASPHFFTRFGGPTAELTMIANGTDSVRQWNGTAFSTPAWTGTAPTGKFLAVTPWDNRLVNARRTGATQGDNPSTVRFSDAVTTGLPLNFATSSFVDLTPGDGEQIMGIVTWRNFLLVFKETKFFRFYGTAVAGSGVPEFRYEGVEGGIGLAASKAVIAARDGVYFIGRDGVYRTVGDTAVLVSGTLDPFFRDQIPDYFDGQPLNQGSIAIAAATFWNERLYFAVPTGTSTTNNRLLEYDPQHDWWAVHDIAASSLTPFKVSSRPDLMFGYAAGAKNIGRHRPGQTTDDGATIVSRARYGWWNCGGSLRKQVRETLVWGKGKLNLAVAPDFSTSSNGQDLDFGSTSDTWGDGSSLTDLWANGTTADTWGAGTRLRPRMNRRSVSGTVLSVEFRNVDATSWAVYRLTYRLRPDGGQRAY